MRRPILLLVLAPLAASPAVAQTRVATAFATAPRAELPPSPTARGDTIPGAPADTAAPRANRGTHIAGRSAFGALGWFGGAAAGALAGLAIAGDDEEDDLEDVTGVVLGALLGSTAGGGIGAAIPRYGSRCSLGRRVGNGLLGSLAGTLVVAALANATRSDEAGFIVPVGSGVGAALAVGC